MFQEKNPSEQFQTSSNYVKPKKNFILRLLKILGIVVVFYIVLAIVFISINPVFGWLFLYPVFVVQSLIAQFQNSAVENKISNMPESSVVLSTEVIDSDCIGLFGTVSFMKNDYPGISDYAKKLGAGRFDHIAVCKTSKGIFVIESSLKNNGDTNLNQVYMDENGNLIKIFEFNDYFSGLVEDNNKNVFLIKDLPVGVNTSSLIFAYDSSKKTFLKVVQTGDTLKICLRDDNTQCTTWKLKNFSTSTPNMPEVSKKEKTLPMTSPSTEGQISMSDLSNIIMNSNLDLSGISGYGRVQFKDGEATISGKNNLSISSITYSSNYDYAVARIAKEDTPPWEMFVVVIDIKGGNANVLKILSVQQEIFDERLRAGLNTNLRFNFDAFFDSNNSFTIKYYNSANGIKNSEINYSYVISDNNITKK